MIESQAPGPGDTAPSGVREFVRFLNRRKLIILAPTILVTVATWLVVSTIAPQYAAEAALALDARKVQIVQNEVVSRLPEESPVVRTELDVVASRSLIERVVDRLALENDRGFLREVAARHSTWEDLVDRARGVLARRFPDMAVTAPAAIRLTRSQLVDWLTDHLKVSNDGRSFTIIVSYTSEDPKRAAKITNAVAEEYLADQVRTKAGATTRANVWLGEKLAQLRRDLEKSEAAVDNFRRQNALIETNGATIPAQTLTELNKQLVGARLELTRAEARFQIAREGDPATNPDVIASPVIRQLQENIAENDTKIAEQRYRGFSYEEEALHARAAALRQHMNRERSRILASLSREMQEARKREAELAQSFKQIERQLGDTTRSATQLSQLKRDADANRSIYETFLARYKETMEQEGLAAPDARLITRADPPSHPTYPKKLQLLVLGTLAGLGLGAGLGYVRDGFDRRIRQMSDIAAVTGIPVFGQLPRVSRWRLLQPQDYPVRKPASRFCTSLVQIHTALQAPGSPVRGRGQVILVTSAKAGEGKTSFCTSLARSLARHLTRVLVIDVDPYRRRVASAFGNATASIFGPIAEERAELRDLVQSDVKSGAHFIAAPNERDLRLLLNSGGFARLIEEARRAYDIVILDTPPVMTSADAAVVGRFADACLFLVRRGRARWDEVTWAIGYLRLCGIRPDGIVMVGTDARSAHYGPIGSYGSYGTTPATDRLTPPPSDRRAAGTRQEASAEGFAGWEKA
jgi:uncharacterized protein involved in exopolysaccharide biosynthesis/Mrp family chromosome partitioning ATPase